MPQLPPAAEAAFETAHDMMESIRSIKGEQYAHTVEVALTMMKIRDLMGSLLVALEDEDLLSEDSAEKVFDLIGHMSARVIGLTRMCWDQSDPTKQEADEIMGWADRLREYEDRGANEVLKSMGEDDDN